VFTEVKGGGTRLDELARLYRSPRLEGILKEMARFDSMQRTLDKRTIVGPVEADPEYRLIVEANNIAAEIDNEIGNNGYYETA
jgi:U4/U6 small nuclear ribonucleoprotein PRP31